MLFTGMCRCPSTTPGLDLEVLERVLLLLRKVAHLRLGEADVVEVALADLRDGALDLLLAQAEILRRPVVEFLRQVAHRRVAPRLDVGEDRLDGLAHFCGILQQTHLSTRACRWVNFS